MTPTEPFDQYPFLIEDTARLSDRRQTVNNIYLTVNSVLLGGLALLVQVSGLRSFSVALIAVFIAFAGYIITGDWRKLVITYKQLLGLRFKLLRELEEMPEFPYPIKTYHREDDLYADNPKKKRSERFGFTAIEEKLPTVFTLLYIVSAILIVVLVVLLRYGIVARLARDGIIPSFLVPPQ